ncbi:MAG: hypothetical protein E7005_03180 [Alphaproteobacteria bacterium]|nr:hypothetical protein [Alphaproteobacteria bacterium]
MLEDYKQIICLMGCSGILMCLTFLFYFKRWEKKHPNIYTTKATPEEKSKTKNLVMFFMGSIMLYIVAMLFILSYLAEERINIGIAIPCGLFASFAISVMIPLFKK